MAVAFDAVGPSSAGATGTTASLTWAHTITGANTVLIAGVAVDAGSDAGLTCACTYNAVAMTSLAVRHSGGGTSGFVQVFGIVAAAGASHNVVATVSGGTPANITGGSLSFTGAAQTVGAAFGTPASNDSASVTVTTHSATLPASTSGNIVAGFCTQGAGISSATAPSTSRFINSKTGSGAAGSCAGATSPATGSPVTMAWAFAGSDWAAEILAEILPAASGTPIGLASGAGAALGATIVTSTTTTGPRYAGAAADLGGVYGTWNTPQYATGGP